MGMDCSLRPSEEEWESLQVAVVRKPATAVSEPLCCDLRCSSDVFSPRTQPAHKQFQAHGAHRHMETPRSSLIYNMQNEFFILGFKKMEKFQLSLTHVPFGLSALQSSWRGSDCNVSRVVFASENCRRGSDDLGSIILGVE